MGLSQGYCFEEDGCYYLILGANRAVGFVARRSIQLS